MCGHLRPEHQGWINGEAAARDCWTRGVVGLTPSGVGGSHRKFNLIPIFKPLNCPNGR